MAVLAALAALAGAAGVPVNHAVRAERLSPEAGHAHAVSLRLPWPLTIPADGPEAPRRSALELFEDGYRLGPPHALHDTIRREGGGAYSHWGGALYFSTPDDSDPRSNGRLYEANLRVHLAPAMLWAFGIFVAAVAARLAVGRRHAGNSLLAARPPLSLAVAYGVLASALLVGTISTTRERHAGVEISQPEGSPRALEVHRDFSWRTLSKNLELRVGPGPAGVFELSVEAPATARAVAIHYRSTNLGEVAVRLAPASLSGEEGLAAPTPLYGTSPGFVHRMLTLPERPVGSRKGPMGYSLALEVGERAHPGVFVLTPLRFPASPLAEAAWERGWLPALLHSPLLLLALVPALVVGLVARDWAHRPALFASLGGLAVYSAGSAWLPPDSLARVPLTLLELAIFSLAKLVAVWQPLPPLATHLPPAVVFTDEFLESARSALLALRPSGYLMTDGRPENIEPFLAALTAWSSRVPLSWLAPATGGILLSLLFLWGRAGSRPRSLATEGPALAVLGLYLTVFVAYPSWQLETGEPAQRLLALLLLALGLLLFLGLSGLAEEPLPAPAPASGGWRAAAWLLLPSLAYLVLGWRNLSLPSTFNSDEGASFGTFQAYGAFPGPSLPYVLAPLALLAWWVSRRLPPAAARWRLPLSLAAVVAFLLVALLAVEIQPLSSSGLFRYPPLPRLLSVPLVALFGSSIELGRFTSLALFAASGYVVGRIVLETWSSVYVAALASAAYLFSQIVSYWGAFASDAPLMMLFYALALLLYFRWLRSPDQPRWLYWLAPLLVAAYFARISAFFLVLALLSFHLAVLALSRRHRGRRSLRATAFLFVGVLTPVLLWQKFLVGSWMGWVGRTLPLEGLLYSYQQADRFALPAWTFLNTNGPVIWSLAGAGLLLAVLDRRYRALGLFCLWLGLAEVYGSQVLGRMAGYDGYTRFLIPVTLPVAFFVASALNGLRRVKPAGLIPAVAVALLAATTAYDLESMPCVHPTDLNPYVQYNGNEHGFFPEKLLLAHPRLQKAADSLVLAHVYAVGGEVIPQMAANELRDTRSIWAEMERTDKDRLVMMRSSDPACHQRIWNPWFRRQMDPAIWDDPRVVGESPYFDPLVTIPYGEYEILVFERAPSEPPIESPPDARPGAISGQS